jgi:hypothetical protein
LAKKYDIYLVEATSSITEPVTKFGGQPVWIDEPQWPLGRQTGEKMQFVCQVALDADLFRVPSGMMAYVFRAGGAEGEYVDGTWDPEAGENAVIVQASTEVPYDGHVEAVPSATGPTLYRFEEKPGGRLKVVSCEYAVELTPGEDEEPVSEEEQAGRDDDIHDAYLRLAGRQQGRRYAAVYPG